MGLELDGIFHPRSIAVAGASTDPEKRGHAFVEALLHHRFPGPVYPINPRGQDILGLKAYKSILEVPGPVDYVISSIPASAVLKLVEECAHKGVRAIHFFTARFSETGDAHGAELEREVLRRARQAGIRVLGPNCMGLYYPAQGISFMRFPREPGPVGILSQSGGNAHESVFAASLRGVRFSKVVSYGNAIDINEADLIEYFAADPQTKIIGGYIEGVRDGPRLVRALREAAARKPVVLLKGGGTEAGTRAVASHTASLAGSRQLWQALLRQSGAVMVESMEELVDTLVAFQFCPPATGHRVAVIGGGGGRAVESADSCESAGLRVEPIPASLREEFRKRVGGIWGDWISNPADGSILGGSGLNEQMIAELMASSPAYDMVLVNVRDLWTADSREGAQKVVEVVDGYVAMAGRAEKPFALVMNDVAGTQPWQNEVLVGNRRRVAEAGFPVFPTVRRAARALDRMATYYQQRRGL